MTALHETEIDGVRCFWVETGRPTLAAFLVFRYGMADEPIVESGWQHLLEHLALKGRDGEGLQVNGQVSPLETVFQAHGPAAEVATLLGGLTAWLAEPDLTQLAHEAKVLRAETNMRGTSSAASALTMRYGARGPGLAGYQEPGIGRAAPAGLVERAARVFTQGNAALVLDGPPPPGLRLHLAPGALLPFTPAVPCGDRLPAAYFSESGLVVSGVVPRSVGMGLGHELLREGLSARFREQEGAAYAPWVTYQPVDGENAVVVGGSDIHPDAIGPVADSTLMLVRGLRTHLPEPEVLQRLRTARIQSLVDPYAKVGIAVRAAHEVLQGRPPLTLDEMVAEIHAVDAEELREDWRTFHDSMLLGVPGGARWADQLPVLEFPSSVPTRDGKRYRSVNWPADRRRLTISDDQVELSVGDDARRVPLDQVAALFTHDDGCRYLVRHDGYALSVNPQSWRRGESAVALLDAVVPDPLQLPHPAVPGLSDVERLNAWQRWGRAATGVLRSRLDRYLILIGLIAVAAVVSATLLVVRAQSHGVLGVGVFAYLAIRGLLEARDGPRRRGSAPGD